MSDARKLYNNTVRAMGADMREIARQGYRKHGRGIVFIAQIPESEVGDATRAAAAERQAEHACQHPGHNHGQFHGIGYTTLDADDEPRLLADVARYDPKRQAVIVLETPEDQDDIWRTWQFAELSHTGSAGWR